jgi:hypothetical protein
MNQIPTFGFRPTAAALRCTAGLGLLAVAGWPALPLHAGSALLADVSLNVGIDVGPPPPRQEVIVERSRPGPDYVWIGGFWDGAPGHYVWRAGHWDRPPHAHAVWGAPRWERDHDGHYHKVEGGWHDEERRR